MACACCCNHHGEHHEHNDHDNHEHHHGEALLNKQDTIRFACSAGFFVAGIIFNVMGTSIQVPYLQAINIPPLFFIASWFIAGTEVLYAVIKTRGKERIFDENFLMTVATIGAFILGEWAEGAAVMLFYNLGELLQAAAVQQSRTSITGLMDLRPEFVRLYSPDAPHAREETLVDPEDVPVGTHILVKTGEKVPLDGVLSAGSCSFETTSITGESIPRVVHAGETVLAGFVNLDGLAVIKTQALAHETAAAKMLALVEHAQERKTKTEKMISSFARVYTPIVTAAAVLIAILPPVFLRFAYGVPLSGWETFAPWFSRGLVFLVISCPCAFVISVPLGYFGGLGGAAKRGILIKGADFIDALAKTDSVIFDKTGTLTEGVLKVDEVICAAGISAPELLTAAYRAEYYSNHPIAAAVKRYAEQKLGSSTIQELLSDIAALQSYTEKAGAGTTVVYKGTPLAAGSPLFIFGDAAAIPQTMSSAEGVKVAISANGSFIGYLLCSDTVKRDSAQAIRDLRAVGVGYIEMLTGDSKKTGDRIAAELGLDRCSSELLPHEKVRRFEEISAERKQNNKDALCVFVGDGINDAPVLARADAGIAMGGIGSDAAIEAADIVLMNDNPLLIAEGIHTARFTRKIVKQNIILAFSVKIAFLLLGAGGIIGLWAAVFADVGVALLAVCNSLRARH
ncbi:MAG: heavy metal translocating P-type ATPase [Treponema sp.]